MFLLPSLFHLLPVSSFLLPSSYFLRCVMLMPEWESFSYNVIYWGIFVVVYVEREEELHEWVVIELFT
jgi:hypothetical protein